MEIIMNPGTGQAAQLFSDIQPRYCWVVKNCSVNISIVQLYIYRIFSEHILCHDDHDDNKIYSEK